MLIHAGAGGVGLRGNSDCAAPRSRRPSAPSSSRNGSACVRSAWSTRSIARSLAFADEVLAVTGGLGVDVVLNSLAGEFIPASLRALAANGWFLELGKRDIWTPEQVRAARPDVRYRAYQTSAPKPMPIGRSWGVYSTTCVRRLEDGTLRPLPVQTSSRRPTSDRSASASAPRS